MNQKFGHVKTDPARANHSHLGTHGFALKNHVQIAQHLGVINTLNRRGTRSNTGGQDDLVKRSSQQLRDIHTRVQAQLHAGAFQFAVEVTQGFREFLLARYTLGDIELAADLAGRVKQRDFMASLGSHSRG